MVDESTVKENSSKWEPFDFVLTVNDNIVCQRYFKIPNFRYESLTSTELLNAFRSCVNMIKDNLRLKSNRYTRAAAPQIFPDMETAKKWILEKGGTLELGTFVVIKGEETDTVGVWDGSELNRYEGFYNPSEFTTPDDKGRCDIEFSFRYYGKKVYTEGWDGNVYPRFIRNNIDISNKKNRYRNMTDNSSLYEMFMVDYLTENQPDLVPEIANALSNVCSFENGKDYTRVEHYGELTYNFNINGTNKRKMYELESFYRKKTEAYLKSIDTEAILDSIRV